MNRTLIAVQISIIVMANSFALEAPPPPSEATVAILKDFATSFDATLKQTKVDDQFAVVAAELAKLSKKLTDAQLDEVEKFALTKEGESHRWWLAFLFVERGRFDSAGRLYVEQLLLRKDNRAYVMWKYWEHYLGERNNYKDLTAKIGLALIRQFEVADADHKQVIAELFNKGEAEAKMNIDDFKKAINFDNMSSK